MNSAVREMLYLFRPSSTSGNVSIYSMTGLFSSAELGGGVARPVLAR